MDPDRLIALIQRMWEANPTWGSSGFPAPEQAKAQAMPSDDGLRLEEQQDLSPVRPEAPQTHPEQSVGGEEPRLAGVLPAQDGQLMSQGDEFELQG